MIIHSMSQKALPGDEVLSTAITWEYWILEGGSMTRKANKPLKMIK